MAQFILSPEAQNSLRSIRSYSIKNFGAKRTKAYLQSIRKRFHELAETPSRGIIREDLNVGYYSNFVGSHTIYYRVHHTHIDIIDVLHQSMEPSKHITT
ncbi:type II toxin-antitoxin system RelE/ParE family toxin [Colwellia piezophila]|uniref:type II toxin-antitoxin system RelE/ParE family toxin n=1 Tax=Colwellia piezophila TaxID=211668 RepID=UPI00036C5A2F